MSANGINRLYLPRDLTANLHQELAIERLRAEEGLPPQVRKSERMEVLTFLTERAPSVVASVSIRPAIYPRISREGGGRVRVVKVGRRDHNLPTQTQGGALTVAGFLPQLRSARFVSRRMKTSVSVGAQPWNVRSTRTGTLLPADRWC